MTTPHTPSILGIQFRRSEVGVAGEQTSIKETVADLAAVDFISALDITQPWLEPAKMLAGYHGVILGGSGDFDFDGGRSDDDEAKQMSYEFLERLRPLCEHLFQHDIPTFGICYGHQLLGAFAGARVHSDPTQKKTRSHTVKRVVGDDHALFADVPETFAAHYGHKDALDRVPDNAVLIAEGGEACRVSALHYRTNIFSTQFHPELSYADMVARINRTPGYLPEGVAAEDLFTPDDCSRTMLRNFARLVATVARS